MENARAHAILNTKTNQMESFTNGAGWLDVIQLNGGEEIEIIVEFNWDRKGITKDWSVTAWGELGEVTVKHSQNIPTKHYAYTPKDQIVNYVPKPIST